MTPVEVLKKAKALIEERGWCRREYKDTRGCYCSLGACYVASGYEVEGASVLHDGDVTAYATAEKALERAIDSAVIRWNDSPGRTKDEVLAAFDKAIALAEQETSS